jgi:P27 family predicted phage terminase small subunit
MRGRKPVPTKLRELHGNPRKVALPKHEPRPAGDLSTPPDWLNERQRAGWDYVMAHSPPALLKRIDCGALITYIIAEELHRQAATTQGKVGLLVRVKTRASADSPDPSIPMASPFIHIINSQAKIMLKAASELGFTPVARPRVLAGPSLGAAGFGLDAGPNHGKERDGLSLADYLDFVPKSPAVH